MTINHKDLIDIPNERVAKFIINFFNVRGIDTSQYSSSGIMSSNLKWASQCINKELRQNQSNNIDEKIDINHLKSRLADCILPELHFDWLKNNPRATYWFWGKYYLQHDFNGYSLKINNAICAGFLTKEFYISRHARLCHESRYDSILFLFDTQIEANFDGKLNLLRATSNEWNAKFMSDQPFRWLDKKNTDMCRWAYKYIIQFQRVRAKEDRKSVADSFPLPGEHFPNIVTLSPPSDNDELYNAIFALYDLWETTIDRKALFLIHINKAWNQKKVREARKGKKAINTFVSDESKMQLDLLAEKYEMKLNQMLEKLIREKFNEDS